MSAVGGVTGNNAATATDAYSALTSGDFIRIIITEMTRQDPLSPNDTQALLDQLSTIRSIESDLQLASRLETVVQQNEVASASTLVGKFVTGLSESAVEVAGFVDSVSITREGVRVNLSSGFTVPFDRVSEIVDPAIIGIGGNEGEDLPPELVADEYTVESGQTKLLNVLLNDVDDLGIDPTTVQVLEEPKFATDFQVDPETGSLLYTHDGVNVDDDRIVYRVKDSAGQWGEPVEVVISVVEPTEG